MSKLTVGKALLTLTAVYAGAGPYAFDWNQTHIYNSTWPPHAKFHNAQTMSMGASLGLISLGVLWGGRGKWSSSRLQVATTAASLYWATQVSALLYPGVALKDPPAPPTRKGPQVVVAGAALATNLIAFLLDTRRFNRR